MVCKYDWYQNDQKVFITLLRLNVDPALCTVSFSGNFIIVKSKDEVIFEVELYDCVKTDVDVNFTPRKVR